MTKIQKIRTQRAQVQRGLCYYCGQPTWSKNSAEFARTFACSIRVATWFEQTAEHLIAKIDGGRDSSENIVMACRYCNSRRHRKKTPLAAEQQREMVRNRVAKGKWHGHRWSP